MKRERPGIPITEPEMLAAVVSDQIEGLTSLQLLDPKQGIDDVIASLAFVRDRLLQAHEEGTR